MNDSLNYYEGYLRKWTNYVRQYQRRWFVYNRGCLTYFNNRSEVGQVARAQVHLLGCSLKQTGLWGFSLIKNNNVIFSLRAESKHEFDHWLTVIGNGIIECNQGSPSASAVSGDHYAKSGDTIKTTEFKALLDDLRFGAEQLHENSKQLQLSGEMLARASNFNYTRQNAAAVVQPDLDMIEALSSFRDLNNKTLNSLADLVRRAELLADYAANYRASQSFNNSNYEMSASPSASMELDVSQTKGNRSNPVSSDEDSQSFYDAVQDDAPEALTPSVRDDLMPNKGIVHVRSVSDIPRKIAETSRRHRRSIPPRPNIKLNLWNLVSNMIGKDITKVPLPVNFNEPISMLQRVSESLEYSDLLDKAAHCDDPLSQMCYVVAFVVSNYYTTAFRTNKPFNPLLGETYENDRTEDLGWRCVCEQVSHHPPVCAIHAEGEGWLLWETYDVKSRFYPTYLEIQPLGLSQLVFTRQSFRYSWNKVNTYVNNIIVGKLRIEQSGKLILKNQTTGDTATVEFVAEGWLSNKDARKIEGTVMDSTGTHRYAIKGYWNKFVECYKLISNANDQQTAIDRKVLWTGNILPKEAEKMYNFSEFSCSLNEEDDSVAPTDSRKRPDQRAMEGGDFEQANRLKVELEDNQRHRRKRIIQEAIDKGKATKETTIEELQQPLWFRIDSSIQHEACPIYLYKGGYWEAKQKKDFSMCPGIFKIEKQ